MIFGGPECGLQTGSRWESEWFNSTFEASNLTIFFFSVEFLCHGNKISKGTGQYLPGPKAGFWENGKICIFFPKNTSSPDQGNPKNSLISKKIGLWLKSGLVGKFSFHIPEKTWIHFILFEYNWTDFALRCTAHHKQMYVLKSRSHIPFKFPCYMCQLSQRVTSNYSQNWLCSRTTNPRRNLVLFSQQYGHKITSS